MLHCIAIDDEPLSLDILKAYSEPLNHITLACTFTSTALARQYLDNNTVDLIFLDIEMADIDGLSFYRSLNTKPMVIFTTAYSNYAVQGFEVAALDYLLKPISTERFLQATQKASHFMAFHQHNTSFLSVRSEYQTKKIALSEILYIEGLNNHVKIYTDNCPRPILSMMSMKEILSKLSGRRFTRIHRSYIVDLSKVTSYNSRYIFIGNKQFPIGETYRDVTKQLSAGSPLF
ncbi:two component transcriptional regulator, LytTR family [Chitinophaga sp. YR573]|uniref:LytR/AlgR family response regulator transcription factor n=1 Tax=Chitinophaga sp. YR573 TaxID=1881040 RepID=UPI0008C5D130|nr:LytTR family DNA-binding domain-containing protein [Chitinophaga sp. YR573]SEW38911.1 two component transcriptional regulator, LytTR family [Chitinophaga sp. YR573]